ncbi:polysaccharide deacetylase family protein [Streptomyces sp. TRM 70351]|uniref:polysaccharide deacetylase family protein n=1 Tax=Streptomyces sp. TRM 70351 TaxID=3116552 RepID=UPI002E7B4294|nr:polysaccharide deacetylase family protein [Streptomyces sp. TRM 70351]MEE1929248.1 polysaccharide deacetylase family protein [Streptomyces sp. TRM 70351]
MYHTIARFPAPAARRLSVSPEAFAAQMELLAERRHTPLTVSELARAWRGGGPLPRRPVLVTFDDGYAGVHRHALPVLTRLGFSATLFAATGWLRGPQHCGGAPDAMLDWAQLRELADTGVEIGGHSHSHPQLDQLGDAALRREVGHCRALLADALGRAPRSFAYPFGYSSRRVRDAVRTAGFTQSLAVRNALADARRQGPYSLARLTIRRTTTPAEFARLVDGVGVARSFAGDRALTTGYGVWRRARAAAGVAAGRVQRFRV